MGARQFARPRAELIPESQTQSDKRPTRRRARRLQTGTPLATAANQRKGAADWSQLSAPQATAAAAGRAGTEITNETVLQYYS